MTNVLSFPRRNPRIAQPYNLERQFDLLVSSPYLHPGFNLLTPRERLRLAKKCMRAHERMSNPSHRAHWAYSLPHHQALIELVHHLRKEIFPCQHGSTSPASAPSAPSPSTSIRLVTSVPSRE